MDNDPLHGQEETGYYLNRTLGFLKLDNELRIWNMGLQGNRIITHTQYISIEDLICEVAMSYELIMAFVRLKFHCA